MDRIATIQKMLEKTPADTFLRYSLGMELASAGRLDEAAAEFGRCIETDPDYLPAYVEAAKVLRGAGKLASSRQIFERGLELAVRCGDRHTQDFIRQQLEALPQ